MKDQVLQKALSRKAALEAQLSEIDRFIKTYKGFKGDKTGLSKIGKEPRNGKGSTTQNVLDSVAEILSEESPLKPSEIVSRLGKRGISIGGSKPPSNLSAMLSVAKDRFKSLGRGEGWVLLK